MKQALRWLGRGAAGLLGLLVVAAGVALDGVDWTPYLTQPYYAETAERLPRALAAARPAAGELAAGFARVRLTPTVQAAADDPERGRFRALPLAGYGARRGRPATGAREELEVKAVALRVGERRVVLVAVEALIVPAEVTDLAMAQLARDPQLTRGQVYLGATHTHCSLGGWGEGWVGEAFAGPFHPGARVWMAECIVRAVREAVRDLQPAALGHGRFAAPDLVRNRLVGALGQVDPEFNFLVVRQTAGRQAVVGSFAAHATLLGSEVMEFSGDYPGSWQRAVETATGGMAVFFAGGVGSHSAAGAGKGFAGAERYGRELAARLLPHLRTTALTPHVTLGVGAVDLVLPPLNVRVTDGIRLRPWLAQRLLPVRPECVLQALRLNDVIWFSTPCDYSGELALGLKDFLRARGRDGAVTSFNGGYVGYVVPSRYTHLDGYEPRRMAFHGPNVPDYFDETLRKLALGLLRD